MNEQTIKTNKERQISVFNGWPMLLINFVILGLGIWWFVHTILVVQEPGRLVWQPLVGSSLVMLLSFVLFGGFFTLQPNEARALILFGSYHGTVRTSGFHWANPFYARGRILQLVPNPKTEGGKMMVPTGHSRYKISLRARNFNSDKLKVNDKRGNPIEIAAVVVWRVADTAQAIFDVDDYENYVKIQSESAIRHLANAYAYDNGEDNEFTLRSSADEIAHALRDQLSERLNKAGVLVEEARLTHLAYAPEIAQAMLRRQQAEAIIAARQKIVHGAVSMVEMALRELSEQKILNLDEERKASMVSNLMVVLCGETEVHPVINTGTLYA